MQYIYLAMGILIGPAVVPIALTVSISVGATVVVIGSQPQNFNFELMKQKIS